MSGGDPEIDAMSAVAGAIKDLDPEAQARVIEWAAKRYAVQLAPAPRGRAGASASSASVAGEDEAEVAEYGEFAELFAAAAPTTEMQKALVAGYWVQVIQNKPNFVSLDLNRELKHLGHYNDHIGDALDVLIAMKPQQVLQLKKSGNTRQARRTFKLSVAGINAVKAMLGTKNGDEV